MYDLRGSSLSFQHTCSSRSISEKLPLTLEISNKRQHEHAKLQKKKEYCKTHDTSQPMMHAEGAVKKKIRCQESSTKNNYILCIHRSKNTR